MSDEINIKEWLRQKAIEWEKTRQRNFDWEKKHIGGNLAISLIKKCPSCDNWYRDALQEHYFCELCGTRLRDKEKLECAQCSFRAINERTLHDHYLDHYAKLRARNPNIT